MSLKQNKYGLGIVDPVMYLTRSTSDLQRTYLSVELNDTV